MTLLPHLAARLFGVPLAIHRPKLDVILAVLGPRVGLSDLAAAPGYTPPQRDSSATFGSPPGVAVIPIHGTLVRRTVGLEAESGLTSYAGLTAQLDAALGNPAVLAILLDIDSPGGESGGVFDLADRIRAASQIKPVWAVANDMAFSAAYALASAASRVFVSRTGGVGSIGVIAMHVDQSEKDAQDGIHYTAVFAGDRKNDLNPHAPISSEAHAFLKAEVNRIYGLFVETVARHRGIEASTVRDTEAGLFFGQAAVAMGLADAIGTFDDALTQLFASVSPNPTPMAAATRAGSFCNHPMESSMNERSDPAALDRPLADPAGHPAQPSAAAALNVADAIEIAQTCTLAGRADLIAGFLEANTAPAKVRSQLLSAKADASPEIVSRIAPDATRPAPSNPLIDAARNLAAQSSALKKEI
ncbi:MAG: Phage head, head-tail preconnector protease C / Phage head, scaffolding domain Nu3 [Burkholderiaceae bacterium]|jgi:signal peptide peptidase SppA|nr:MAG: Phage head, head-tail preconnector protease C / Phage head, scaffolding domain Nu3 [Burkholderiaceae bacterium]